ncbi:MAG: rhodanese-like domain-containing protein [Ignavibacteriaceae bacterium]|jgi:rhodanese-related sulfurtransferase
MKKFKILITLMIFFTVAAFAANVDSTAKNISVNDFKKEIKTNKSIVILDVRMQDELSGPLGKIDGAINIPLQELEKRIGELNKYKNKELYVISRSGIPSKLAAEILRNHGFTAVNVLGGMMAYRQSGK